MEADLAAHQTGGPYDNYGPNVGQDILCAVRDKKDYSEARLPKILPMTNIYPYDLGLRGSSTSSVNKRERGQFTRNALVRSFRGGR